MLLPPLARAEDDPVEVCRREIQVLADLLLRIRVEVEASDDRPVAFDRQRCESDATAQLLRELDRLELCLDGLAELDDDVTPPTERDVRAHGAG